LEYILKRCCPKYVAESSDDYSHEENQYFYVNFRMAVHNAGLKYIVIPYNPYNNEKNYDVRGLYINYLKMKDFVLLPVFDLEEDEQAYVLVFARAYMRVRELHNDKSYSVATRTHFAELEAKLAEQLEEE